MPRPGLRIRGDTTLTKANKIREICPLDSCTGHSYNGLRLFPPTREQTMWNREEILREGRTPKVQVR